MNKHTAPNILIVDDNKTTRRILKSLLNNLGYDRLLEASHGLEALQIAQQENVDLIISDWNMPQMNGLDLLKTVKSDDRLKRIAFIMVTSEDQRENIRSSVEARVDEYIVKPFTRYVLEKKIKKVLGNMLSMTNFTKPAQKLWDQIPPKARLKILNTVWCAGCRDTVTMFHIKGRVAGGELFLQGKCEKCSLKITRLVENECA